MKQTITINYWWKCSKIKGKIPEPLRDALRENANDRITDMMKEGYVSGELCDNVNIDIPGMKTPKEGYECSGGFEIKGLL